MTCRCGTKQRCCLEKLPSDMPISMKFGFFFQLKFSKILSMRDSSLKCSIKVLISGEKKSNLCESESCLSGHETETSFVHVVPLGKLEKSALHKKPLF